MAFICQLFEHFQLFPDKFALPGQRRDISAAYYSLMVLCVELQKLGNRDRAANATTAPMAPCRRWRGGGGM